MAFQSQHKYPIYSRFIFIAECGCVCIIGNDCQKMNKKKCITFHFYIQKIQRLRCIAYKRLLFATNFPNKHNEKKIEPKSTNAFAIAACYIYSIV